MPSTKRTTGDASDGRVSGLVRISFFFLFSLIFLLFPLNSSFFIFFSCGGNLENQKFWKSKSKPLGNQKPRMPRFEASVLKKRNIQCSVCLFLSSNSRCSHFLQNADGEVGGRYIDHDTILQFRNHFGNRRTLIVFGPRSKCDGSFARLLTSFARALHILRPLPRSLTYTRWHRRSRIVHVLSLGLIPQIMAL